MPVEGRTHIPVVDNDTCNTCAVCRRGCPAELIPELREEESSLRGSVYRGIKTAPSMDGLLDMRPCQLACPIHQDIEGYIRLIAKRKYKEALESIRETNPLPSVTGYVCHHPCEGECTRNSVDNPVSIRALKRFVADFDNAELNPPKIEKKGRKVTIIGSGPAGLTAAHDIAKEGFQVEIIEAFPEPGGMLRWAIPAFRLPRDVLNRDIEYIRKMGVKIRTGMRFGTDFTLSDVRRDGADAIILAIGTHKDLKLGIENEGIDGHKGCLDFLRNYVSGQRSTLGDKVVVIGGGNAAIDAARCAMRCGPKEVDIVYRRGYEEMPADRDEIKEAEVEGVKINCLTMPVRIIQEDGKLKGLECRKTELGEPDESGRRRPIPIEGSEFTVSATSVISAIGQQPDLSWNQEGLFNFSSGNTFITDENCSLNVEGVFAAGDALNGPTTVVEAMASGKKVAKSVALYLS